MTLQILRDLKYIIESLLSTQSVAQKRSKNSSYLWGPEKELESVWKLEWNWEFS